MMNEYRRLKRQHETAVVVNFVGWLNEVTGSSWAVVEHPNPPDAIIRDGDTTSWVEQTDLYRSFEEARSETSFLIRSKAHIPHSEHPIYDPDRRIAMRLIDLLQRKLSSCSYRSAYEKHGPGFLVISERDALFHVDTMAEIDWIVGETEMVDDRTYFIKVYLAIRAHGGMIYQELRYRRKGQSNRKGSNE